DGNGEGLVDTRTCTGSILTSCSSVESEANVVTNNHGDGYRINGRANLTDDVLVGNRGNGATLGSSTLVNVTADANRGDGVRAGGRVTIRDGDYSHKGQHGLELV